MKNKIIIAAVYMSLFGCATSPETVSRVLAGVSSGMIGCQSDMIKITDKPIVIGGLHEWIAECSGKKYACSHLHGGGTNCTIITSQPADQNHQITSAVDAPTECLRRKQFNATLVCPDK